MSVGIYQVPCGPLRVTCPKTVDFFPETSSGLDPTSNKRVSNVFVGSLKLKNEGNHLITYKVISIGVDELSVKPTLGFLKAKESSELEVSVQKLSTSLHRAKIGILILATTCAINDINRIDLNPFWRKIVEDGSIAYIDIFVVKHFIFKEKHNIVKLNYETEEMESAWSDSSHEFLNEPRNLYTPDSDSSSSNYHSGTDSQNLRDLIERNRKFDSILREMKEISGRLFQRNGTLFRRNFMTTFLAIFIIFWTFHLQLGELRFNISSVFRGKDANLV